MSQDFWINGYIYLSRITPFYSIYLSTPVCLLTVTKRTREAPLKILSALWVCLDTPYHRAWAATLPFFDEVFLLIWARYRAALARRSSPVSNADGTELPRVVLIQPKETERGDHQVAEKQWSFTCFSFLSILACFSFLAILACFSFLLILACFSSYSCMDGLTEQLGTWGRFGDQSLI